MHCHEMNNLSSIKHCVQHFLDVSVSKFPKSKSILTFWYETRSSWVALILGISIIHVCIPLQSNTSHCALEGGGTQWRSWLTNYATSQVAGLNPNEVTGFFQFT
jgi:hypothetical protein